jgi:hypothetical protein
MIGRLQKLHLSHAARPSMRLADFSDQDMTAQWRKLQVIKFSKECCLNAIPGKQLMCILRGKRVLVTPWAAHVQFSTHCDQI